MDGALARVWPDGVPQPEIALWQALSDESRSLVATRLRALASYERGGNYARRMREAGLSKPGFFALLRRWRARRSISSVVPRVKGVTIANPIDAITREERRSLEAMFRRDPTTPVVVAVEALKSTGSELSDNKSLDRAARRMRDEAAVRQAIRSVSNLSKDALVDKVRSSLLDPSSVSALRLIVEKVSAETEAGSIGGREGFGRRVFLGSVPAMRRASRSLEGTPWAHVGLAIDVATRTILGSGASADALDSMRVAAINAAEFCETLQERPSVSGRPTLEVQVPGTGNALETMRVLAAASAVAEVDEQAPSEGRKVAARITVLAGRRIGVLDLRPRGAPADAELREDVVGGMLKEEIQMIRSSAIGLPGLAVARSDLIAALRAFGG